MGKYNYRVFHRGEHAEASSVGTYYASSPCGAALAAAEILGGGQYISTDTAATGDRFYVFDIEVAPQTPRFNVLKINGREA